MQTPQVSTNASASELARSVGCMTEADFCDLLKIARPTAETWRKRRQGPTFIRAGNAVLYPVEAVAEFIQARAKRPAAKAPAKSVL
jgi:Helix-turn-helix domain